MPSPAASSPFDQSRYQVRLDWGIAGLRRVAPADVVVVVDVLRFSSTVSARVAAGETVALDAAHAVSRNGAAIAGAASDSVVLLGCLRNADAVATAVLAEQQRRGTRTSIAVIAAGELAGPEGETELRFAVEDLLGAGAVVDALSRLGIDHTSPEAAAACESFRGLGGAVRHLLTASGSGQELLERGQRDDALAAAQIGVDGVAPVLRAGVFTAA
ncbi:2-phosphosulfolactate phosphatase [Microbacterium arborescens]|uniref:2-phosphosulfolactate phosphatase n=1 Tax=Microbacterium arborescens TaxID=33883 RepID=UPI0027810E62|nr:2-phosphosulfolactate phosphatase [Microbacterium arborescens]MDQ1218163.1 2-phosphosulfolactate phosphatase [Microbacterium arborescens]